MIPPNPTAAMLIVAVYALWFSNMIRRKDSDMKWFDWILLCCSGGAEIYVLFTFFPL